MKWFLWLVLAVFVTLLWAFSSSPDLLLSSWTIGACIIIVISAIWVAADSASFGWGLAVFFLWLPCFPSYLIFKRIMGRSGERHIKALNLHRAD